ncbi:MAG: hypothetical protein HY903_00545 [Deltaproteobacteria bacterium]|nr:hypothetical protein [Deltaproteobacteria bacterium]
MLSLVAMAVLAAPDLAADLPPGTDLLLRVEVGKVKGLAKEMADELLPLLPVVPGATELKGALVVRLEEILALLTAQTKADFGRAGVVVTLALDLDAAGGLVWGAVVRGAATKRPSTVEGKEGVEAQSIDGEPAARLVGRDLAWLIRADGTILVGSERGLQRQLRQLLRPASDDKATITSLCRRLHAPGALALVVELPVAACRIAARTMATAGPIMNELKALSLTTGKNDVALRLVAMSDKGRDAVESGMRALVALIRAGTNLIEAGADAVLGLGQLSKWPEVVPKELSAADIRKLTGRWVEGFTLRAAYYKRPNRETEVTLTPSSARGMVAAFGLFAAYLVPHPGASSEMEARLMLMTLRQAEMLYRERHDTFLSCGPVPPATPRGAADWPVETCFDALGFRPPGKVRFQLTAMVEDGNLLLVAKGDPNGDGTPELWGLDETSPMIRRLEAPPDSDAEPEEAEESETEGGDRDDE